MKSDRTIFSVHDLTTNASVDAIVVFDRDWSDVVPVHTDKTFIVWNRRPSFTIEVSYVKHSTSQFVVRLRWSFVFYILMVVNASIVVRCFILMVVNTHRQLINLHCTYYTLSFAQSYDSQCKHSVPTVITCVLYEGTPE